MVMLRSHGNTAEVDSVRDLCGSDTVGLAEILRCARALGFEAYPRSAKWHRLPRLPPPLIAARRDGGFLIIMKAVKNDILVVQAGSRPINLTRAELETLCDGWVVAIARPGRLANFAECILRPLRKLVQRFSRSLALEINTASPEPTNANAATNTQAGDEGLAALVMLLRCHGVAVDSGQIRHRCGAAAIGVTEMLRCAKELGLKARAPTANWDRLARTPLPGIAVLRDGGFLLLGKVADDKILVQRPTSPKPEAMTRAQLEAIWDGCLVLMARRAKLSDLSRRFDITWFLGAVHKYRHLLVEVLVISFFLQLFALVSPLFFQVVIDKVLVHRSLSTLDVLMIGLVAIALFEGILGTLRTYLFAHTTNRADVELGARLFRHLLALPIAYFQARRVGDSVARVRELENIRQFLTSSALTLVIDLLFTFVFLAVMFYYSPLLTFAVLAAFPFYIGISAGATPLFRRRLNEKFQRGSENQAFLVESVTGVETLKAMAVEPQMQRRWEEQLAGYVTASFRVITLSNAASQTVQVINKLVIAAILYLGAKLVIDGSLTVGELVAFNMLAARVSAPVLRLAQMWRDFHQARLSIDRLGDILNTMPEPSFNTTRAALPPIRGQVTLEHVTGLAWYNRYRCHRAGQNCAERPRESADASAVATPP
jgi:subfamily B ATP-binding cassette protein HlyB/CyaB